MNPTRNTLLATLILLTAIGAAPAQAQESGWLDAAQGVRLWLASVAIEDGVWPADALAPETTSLDLGNGTAGVVLFHLALHEATGDAEALAMARAGGHQLRQALPDSLVLEGFPGPTGLYYGLAGVGDVLLRMFEATDDPLFEQAATQCARLIVESARTDLDGNRYWSDRFDELMFGNAGTILFLLRAAESLDEPQALPVAASAGRRLLAASRREAGRWSWPMRRDEPDMILPNFSHGGGGIGFVLCALYAATGEQEYLDGALGAARALEDLAVREHGGVLFPYGFGREQWHGRYDLGWGHGVAGTARLFAALHELTGDAHWDELAAECAEAVFWSGAPDEAQAGFEKGAWGVDRRFGLAGVVTLLLDRHRAGDDPKPLELARRIAWNILDQGQPAEALMFWETPRPAFVDRPGEAARYTGWSMGAAGIGLMLLELDAAERGLATPKWSLDHPASWKLEPRADE